MRLAEVLLRLGCHLVGWLIIYSHFIWLGVIPHSGCGSEGEELFRLSLAFSPIAVGAALLLGPAHRLIGVTDYLKWLATPLILLLPLAVIPVMHAFIDTTLGGSGLCPDMIASSWHRGWAPLQLATILFVLYAALRFITGRPLNQWAGRQDLEREYDQEDR